MKKILYSGINTIKIRTSRIINNIKVKINLKSDITFSNLGNNLNNSNNANNSKKENIYQKIECFDINDLKKKKEKYKFVKIENEDPQIITLNEKQKTILKNYINKSLYDFNSGLIYIDDNLIHKYQIIIDSIETDGNVKKSCVDYVLQDMRKSFTKEGYYNMLNTDDNDDIFIFEHKIK